MLTQIENKVVQKVGANFTDASNIELNDRCDFILILTLCSFNLLKSTVNAPSSLLCSQLK